jgi:predicted metal-dependent phosphoesterase TrpH
VTLAQKLGIRVLAVADHDSVGGVKEAMEAGAGLSVQVVPAVEMSLRNEPEKGFLELHLLGYYIDVDHPELQSVLAKSLEGQIDRIRSMVGKLRALGFDVSEQEVFDLAKEGVPHRTHIWLVVASHHGLTQPDRQPFFDEYLKPGGKAFTWRIRVTRDRAQTLTP